MTELLVGTRKGLFVLDGKPGGGFEVTARAFAGQSVEYAIRDTRSGRYLASVTSWFYGPRIWVTDDPRASGSRPRGSNCPKAPEACPDLGDRAGRGGRPRCTRAAIRASSSRAGTAASRGRSTAASGITPPGRTGTRATAVSACTRSPLARRPTAG